MNGQQVVGLDIAKHVFQMHTVNMGTGEIINVQIKRAKVAEHFANLAPCLVAIEACGGAHHWARELGNLGHTVRLLHTKSVRPFVGGNKTDATDARAIWLAVQTPGVKFVGTPLCQTSCHPLLLMRTIRQSGRYETQRTPSRIQSADQRKTGKGFACSVKGEWGNARSGKRRQRDWQSCVVGVFYEGRRG